MRVYGESAGACDTQCSGEDHQICGGANDNSVFSVTQGTAYHLKTYMSMP